ncbi:MAG TPA: LacI family DNA-binding transcriptional regulator [Treponemataceae bacterium]|nr:MAG: LacI family transcriptional regulator [Treponema sp.]HOC30044.1 LacI family DNA-binding transcriptional regulator [Treponemataceae bacterium]
MAVTLSDVAKHASLSRETILEVLVSPSSIEPEVVRFVMQTIRETGYLETFAPWKIQRKGMAIALVSPSIDAPAGMEVFKGIDRAMSSLGLTTSMVTIPTRHSPTFREQLLNSLLPFNMIDAVICLTIKPDDETFDKYTRVGKPIVLVETKKNGSLSVLLENQKGISIGMNYLYGRGYRRIALMNGPSGGSEPGSIPGERLIAYLSSLHRLGLPFDESLIYEAPDYDSDSGIHGFEYFSSLPQLPDALFCASGDMTAIGFINAARNKGIRVPEDIAVLGYDDLPVSALVYPGLSTIRQRLMIAGAGALVLALECARNGPGENLVIMPELVERGTA